MSAVLAKPGAQRLEAVRRKFREGADEFRPGAFLFLNQDFEQGRLRRKLIGLRDAGITEVVACPRSGLLVPYGSDEFFAGMKMVVEICAELGLKVWIYDDYNWPSGQCAGAVLQRHSDARQAMLRTAVASSDITPEQAGIPGGAAIAAYRAVNRHDGKVVDLLSKPDQAPEGKGWVFIRLYFHYLSGNLDLAVLQGSTLAPWASQVPGYPDISRLDVVQTFIELTHEAYLRLMGAHFGKTILGFFTDEPGISRNLPMVLDENDPLFAEVAFPWSDQIPGVIKGRCGYDIFERLHELAFDVGKFRTTRQDFWEAISRLYAESYHRTLGDWCAQHGVRYIGHVLWEENLSNLLHTQGNPYGALRHFHHPGIDRLGYWTGLEKPHRSMAPKLAAGVARSAGQAAVYCESFGAGGTYFPPRELKRVADWLACCGVSRHLYHAAFLSVAGLRKRDNPPHLDERQPWWTWHRRFSDHLSRTGFIGSVGRSGAAVAVFFPLKALWQSYSRDGAERFNQVGRVFEGIVAGLLRRQVDFDLVFRETLARSDMRVEDGRLAVADSRYRALVVPDSGHSLAQVAAAIGPSASEIEIIAVDNAPGNAAEASELVLFEGAWLDRLVRLLEESGIERLRLDGEGREQVFCTWRRVGNADFWLLGNPGARAFRGTADLPVGRAVAEIWDPVTGESTPADRAAEPGRVKLVLAPGEALVLVGHDGEPAEGRVARPGAPAAETINLVPPWRIAPDRENVLRFDKWKAARASLEEGQSRGYHHGYQDGLRGKGVKTARLARVTTAPGARSGLPPEWERPGEEIWLSAAFQVNHVPDSLKLVREANDQDAVFFVNGQIMEGCWQAIDCWDSGNRAIEIASLVKQGENTLAVWFRYPSWAAGDASYHGVEPVAILGDFSVAGSAICEPVKELTAGSWHLQGFPNYSARITYHASIDLVGPDRWSRAILGVTRLAEAMMVRVNGEQAGVRLWPPWEVDVTGLLRPGANEIEVMVANTNANLLERPRPSGILGRMALQLYK